MKLMKREQAIAKLREYELELKVVGVISALFGSVARDDAGPDSDLDVVVQVSRGAAPFGSDQRTLNRRSG